MRRTSINDPMHGIHMHGASFRLDITRNGTREKINLQTADPAEAILRKRRILEMPASGPKGDLLGDTKRYVEEKVRDGIFSRGSARVNKDMLTEFAKATGGLTTNVRLNHITAHYAMLQKRVKEATAQIHMRAIGSFFTWAVDRNLCPTHPGRVKLGDGLVKPAFRLKKIPNRARERFCTKAERDALIAAAPTDDLKFILMCGFLCGMRKNEIIEARVKWFNLEADPGSVYVENTPTFRIKGDGKAHHIPLVPIFKEFLTTYLAGKDREGWALKPKTKHGKGIYRYDFERPFKDFLAGEKMKWVTAHVMRHTFASHAAQNGISLLKIAIWLGDGVETTRTHYVHLSPQDRELEKIE